MKERLANRVRIAKRNAASFLSTNMNRALGRSFVRDPRFRLFIEPVSFCNLECKFCSYPKNLRKRTVMPDEMFARAIADACAMGFRSIALTPITGDVFMDKKFIDRLRLVDQSGVDEHVFYTNFIGADVNAMRAIFALGKLRYMEISIYGHDAESFRAITGRDDVQYRRLLDNLSMLIDMMALRPKNLELVVGIRTYRSFDLQSAPRNALLEKIDALAARGIPVGQSSTVDNWGGDVTQSDVAGIEMDLTDGSRLYKNGPCSLPFDSVQITATGEVNACACRDPRGSLLIGDLNTAPLADILSARNEKWMGIIEDHEKGQFNDVCRKCGFYQSIYDARRRAYGGMISKAEYMSRLDDGS